jgi:hypothetical protein
MAVDKLVDSAQLNADLTSVANAIRTKGGTSWQLAFPAGFVQAIGDISGGDNSLQYVRQLLNTFYPLSNTYENVVPSPLELNLPNCEKVSQAFNKASAFDGKRLVVILHFNADSPVVKQLNQAVYYSEIRELKITGDLSGVTSYENFMQYTNNIEKIDAELDFTSAASTAAVRIGNGGGTTLTYIRYKANTLSYSQSLASQRVLDEDSLISIANGLNETATGQTLTLYSTRKDLCDTIMGTVGMDATNTFHVFTKDSGGSVTLTDFIANTKGWTLA